jgi:hypothetical protein
MVVQYAVTGGFFHIGISRLKGGILVMLSSNLVIFYSLPSRASKLGSRLITSLAFRLVREWLLSHLSLCRDDRF